MVLDMQRKKYLRRGALRESRGKDQPFHSGRETRRIARGVNEPRGRRGPQRGGVSRGCRIDTRCNSVVRGTLSECTIIALRDVDRDDDARSARLFRTVWPRFFPLIASCQERRNRWNIKTMDEEEMIGEGRTVDRLEIKDMNRWNRIFRLCTLISRRRKVHGDVDIDFRAD